MFLRAPRSLCASSCAKVISLTSAILLLSALHGAPASADIHLLPNDNAPLSGKTVVFSPGHGIFKDSGTWRFQRGILHGLREDIHTNEIFIQYIQYYLSNAGARVESVRERSFQRHEAIVDNSDAGYSETGSWTNSTSNPEFYGSNYRYAAVSGNESATASFQANLPESGRYPVYVWFTTGSNRPSDAQYTVYHSGGQTTRRFNQQGPGNHWLFLGDFHFEKNTPARVVLSNQSQDSNKFVIADAVRFGGGVGQSGLPRWREAAVEFMKHKGFSSTRSDVTIRPVYARYLAGDNLNSWRDDFLYMALHTNAGGGGTATGLSTFSYSNGRTPSWGSSGPAHYPSSPSNLDAESDSLRAAVHNEILNAVRGTMKASWPDRNLHRMNFGELRENRNMPSALIELGFHDSADDANLLSSNRFREIAARAIYKGILRYWLPSATICPLAPDGLRLENLGNGQLRVSWSAVIDPLESSATPNSYKVYLSSNGRGFDNGRIVTGNSTVISNLADGQPVFVRVAALNNGGESLPSRVGGALVGPISQILVVDGFDREYKHSESNIDTRYSYDYIIEHLDALAFARPLAGIDYCCNEAVIRGDLSLSPYQLVDWLLGREGSIDRTFDGTEQQLVEDYLMAGGSLLASGTEIGWDLQARNGGPSFLNDVLGTQYVGDDAGSFDVLAAPNGPLSGAGGFSYDNGQGGRYAANSADRLVPMGSASQALTYDNGEGAAVAVAKNGYRVMILGFPIETITDQDARRTTVSLALDFLMPSSNNPNPGPAPVPAPAPAPTPSAGGGGGGGGGCQALPLGHSNPAELWPFLVLLALLWLKRRA